MPPRSEEQRRALVLGIQLWILIRADSSKSPPFTPPRMTVSPLGKVLSAPLNGCGGDVRVTIRYFTLLLGSLGSLGGGGASERGLSFLISDSLSPPP